VAGFSSIRVRELGLCDYSPIYEKMCAFSLARETETVDEFWVLEHKPVYTLGLNAKKEHILNSGDTPIVQVDRGGQVTYHGPGQLIVYLLIDIKRKSMGVRAVVTAMEDAIIATLSALDIRSNAKPDAPGVYVNDKKIAALGLRIKNGKSYHGLSLNIDMNLEPFKGINPCGYENLDVIQIKDLVAEYSKENITANLLQHLKQNLKYEQ